MGLTEALAARAAASHYDDLGPVAIAAARRLVLDGIAVAVAGTKEAAIRILAAHEQALAVCRMRPPSASAFAPTRCARPVTADAVPTYNLPRRAGLPPTSCRVVTSHVVPSCNLPRRADDQCDRPPNSPITRSIKTNKKKPFRTPPTSRAKAGNTTQSKIRISKKCMASFRRCHRRLLGGRGDWCWGRTRGVGGLIRSGVVPAFIAIVRCVSDVTGGRGSKSRAIDDNRAHIRLPAKL